MRKESNWKVSERIVSIVVYLLLCAICIEQLELMELLFSSYSTL